MATKYRKITFTMQEAQHVDILMRHVWRISAAGLDTAEVGPAGSMVRIENGYVVFYLAQSQPGNKNTEDKKP